MEIKVCKDQETIKNRQANVKMGNTELLEMNLIKVIYSTYLWAYNFKCQFDKYKATCFKISYLFFLSLIM